MEATTLGWRPTIRCVLGLFVLGSFFVRLMLKAKALLRPRHRSGLHGAIYEQVESKLVRTDVAQSRGDQAHNGFIKTDGNDPKRGFVDDGDDACNSVVDIEDMDGGRGGAGDAVGQQVRFVPGGSDARGIGAAAADDGADVPEVAPFASWSRVLLRCASCPSALLLSFHLG